ncbi:hypothetical protein CR513_59223, partial [Mucuna pruriens]
MEECNLVYNPIVPDYKLCKDEVGVKVNATQFKQMVGSLIYITTTRSNLMFMVSLISSYMSQPAEMHAKVAKRNLKHLKGTKNYGILYNREGIEQLLTFTNSDYAENMEDKENTSGYVFLMSRGYKPIVILSTTKVEFITMARVLKELGYAQQRSTLIMCDNCSTMKLSEIFAMHGRSKHIGVRFHFLKDITRDGVIELVHYGTQDQTVDVMIEPLKLDSFEKLRMQL